jgi:DME family drug/metabolite transporter
VLALAAGACYAVYTVCAKRLLDDDADTVSVLAATLGVGAALSVPTFCAGASGFGHADGVLLALWLGGAATAGAYVLFAGGLARVSAATAGTLSLAEPLMAAALGIAVLAERPPAVSLAGAGALILGLALNPIVDTLGPVGPSLRTRLVASTRAAVPVRGR